MAAQVVFTETIFDLGRSRNGEHNSAQLKVLLPAAMFDKHNMPISGWKKLIIGSKVTQGQIDRFLLLTDTHLNRRAARKRREPVGQTMLF